MQPLWLTCEAAICDTRPDATPSQWHFELTHQFEHFVALLDFFHREIAQPIQAECFHAKTGKYTPVDHCFAQVVEVHAFDSAGKISSHAPGERVPCPGWIVNIFERIRATTEELISVAKQQCAVLAFLYRDILRPHFADATPGLDKTGFLGYFACFAVIQDEKINASP